MSALNRQSLVDIAIGMISLGLGLGVYFLTFGFQIGASSGLASGMDASLYPRIIASILIVLGLILLVKTVFLNRTIQSQSADTLSVGNGKTGNGLIKLFPLGIGFTIAFPLLGYFASTGIFVAAMLFVAGERRLVPVFVTTIVVVASFYLLFRYGFNIVLPEGRIWRPQT
jgi:hypothetical protein